MVIPLAGLFGLFVVSPLEYYVAFQCVKRNAEDVAMAMEYWFESTNEIFGENVIFRKNMKKNVWNDLTLSL